MASGRWTKKPRLRRAVRYVLAILFCMIVAVIVLTDPFCATVLAAGRRLRRPRAEKAAITLVATSTEKERAP
ncbi:MAG: hypothetical protein NTV51_02260 [Verrucomicrobia bacterium]|nr:hypothetical protein [Verrucomicrobiota bacterium]